MAAKLIIFDLGKVLIDFDFGIAIKKLRAICPINILKVRSLFRNSSLAEEWDKGNLPQEQFFEAVKKELHLPMNMEDFIPLWNDIFTENKNMIELALSQANKRKVYVLSNTNPWHADYIRKNCPWLKLLHGFVASCEVHLLKPDPKIFQLTLDMAGAAPSETLYIDDLRENVRSAKRMGMDALVFTGYESLARGMKRLD